MSYGRYYQIAGLTLQVESDLPLTDTTFQPKFKSFQVEGPGEDTVVIRHHFGLPDLARMDLGQRVYRRAPWAIYRQGDSWIYLSVSPTMKDTEAGDMAILSDDHTRAEMYHAREDLFRKGDCHSLTLFTTDQILLARVLADRQGCYLHAAGAILHGQGLLLAGHAEAGKSTMLRMLQTVGAGPGPAQGEGQPPGIAPPLPAPPVEILCDDRMIVRRWPEGFCLHGTWSHGEVPDVSPHSARLRAILFLEKAPENRLIPLSARKEIVTRLLAVLITPLTSGDWWDKSLTLVEQIAREVPCYLLRFDQSGQVVGVLEDFVRAQPDLGGLALRRSGEGEAPAEPSRPITRTA